MQKATNNLAGVYQAGSVLPDSSIEEASGCVPTDVLVSTSWMDAFSMPTARAIKRSAVIMPSEVASARE